MTGDAAATESVARQVARITGVGLLRLDPLEVAGSFVPNHHYRATLADGTTVFVKEASGTWALDMIESERATYGALGRRAYLPRYLGGDETTLVIEDLGSAHWPPPWRAGDLRRVLATLADIAATPAPPGLRDLNADGMLHCWGHVAKDPHAFLGLGLCTSAWFEQVADRLVATDSTPLGGEALVHGDFRGDNVCLLDDRVVAVDWAAAARGRVDYDQTAFALSFSVETGEPPEHVAPDADAELVAVIAGTRARFGGDASVPARVREQLTDQLRVALAWWARITAATHP